MRGGVVAQYARGRVGAAVGACGAQHRPARHDALLSGSKARRRDSMRDSRRTHRPPINGAREVCSPAPSDGESERPGVEPFSQCTSLQRQATGFSWRSGGRGRRRVDIVMRRAPGTVHDPQRPKPKSNLEPRNLRLRTTRRRTVRIPSTTGAALSRGGIRLQAERGGCRCRWGTRHEQAETK